MGASAALARVLIGAVFGAVLGAATTARAQSAIWDATISNTHWYVPAQQLLAYASSGTSFSNPIPIGDQTLWTLGVATNGVFNGVSDAQLKLGPIQITQTALIQGFVTTSGQITMLFTPAGGGATTVGLGRMTLIDGVTSMEMQMITGDSLLVTHWAYMLPYDPMTFTPPPPVPLPANSVPQWAWASGTPWSVVSPQLFGTNQPGRLIVSNYQNGYFWGRGIGPNGQVFTLLGSVTPEGKVLLATLSNASLTTLYGDATGDAAAARMLLESYDASSGVFSGDFTNLFLIPPYVNAVRAANNPAAVGAAEALYRIAGSSLGLDGAMAPAITALNGLSGTALSTAVSQTLPVITGAASRATYQAQRAFQHVLETRLDALQVAEPERRLWVRPFGGMVRQERHGDVAGYRASGGGAAAGIEELISPGVLLGGAGAISSTSITGGDETVPNTLGVESYQAGLYGALAPAHDVVARFQAEAVFNRNRTNRSITFMNAAASAGYDSATVHVGGGLAKAVRLAPWLTLAPSLNVDYGEVRADAYSEGGAGALSLNVHAQTYRELMLTSGVKASFQAGNGIEIIAKGGVGYNALNEPTMITASYSGGGDPFVTQGLSVSPWLCSAGLGMAAHGIDGVDLSLHYDLQASPSAALVQSASLVFRRKI